MRLERCSRVPIDFPWQLVLQPGYWPLAGSALENPATSRKRRRQKELKREIPFFFFKSRAVLQAD